MMDLLTVPHNTDNYEEVLETDDRNDVLYNAKCPVCTSKDTYKRKSNDKYYIVCDSCKEVFIPVKSGNLKTRIIIEDGKLFLLH